MFYIDKGRFLEMNTIHTGIKRKTTLSPFFLTRIGGLSIDVVQTLGFERSASYHRELATLEQALEAQKDELVAYLHAAVQAHKENQAARRGLLRLKRDVFNLRVPRDEQKIAQVAALLPDEERSHLLAWNMTYQRHAHLLAAYAEAFAQEYEEKRLLLKGSVQNEDFRKGLLLASPLLENSIEHYLASDNRQLNRNARTAERSLVEYLLRAACKTSPFSTFTSISIGQFETDADSKMQDVIAAQMESMQKRSFTRFNVGLLSRLSSFLLHNEHVQDNLPVRIVSGWRLEGKHIKYVRRRSSEALEDGPLLLDILHENFMVLPLTSLMQALLRLMGQGQEKRLQEIITYLAQEAGRPLPREQVVAYLHHLLRLGFLIVPALHIDIHSADCIAQYCRGLRSFETSLTATLADHLAEINTQVKAYASSSLHERRTLLTSMKAQIERCYTLLGRSASIPSNIVYEDTTVQPRHLHIQQGGWQPLQADLEEFQQLLPVFDIAALSQLLMKGYYRARYGKGQRHDDFLAFATDFYTDFYEQYRQTMLNHQQFDEHGNLKRNENTFDLPEVLRLYEARQAVTDYITQAYASLPEHARELTLGEEFFQQIRALMPEQVHRRQSHAFFAQFARLHEDPLLVLNKVYLGEALMFSRFAYCYEENPYLNLVPTLSEALERDQPANTVFAELKGGYEGMNLNLHPSLTAYELVCPGDTSTRAESEQIRLDDLSIQDDLHEDRLRLLSRRLNKEVIPLYQGYLFHTFLPENQQVLLNFSHLSWCLLNLWNGVKRSDSGEEITFYPRLRYKHLVLQRAMWKLDVSSFPQRPPLQSDADFFLEIARWRRKHGIPRSVFFRYNASALDAKQPGKAATPESRKPVYIDFENYFAVSLLETLLRKVTAGQVTLLEMLPAQEDLWIKSGEEAYVSEIVFEMNQSVGENYEA
jgi:hypothetical protein